MRQKETFSWLTRACMTLLLAFFAISAMGIQDANAQNEVKVKKAETTAVSEEQGKPSTSTVSQVPVQKIYGQ